MALATAREEQVRGGRQDSALGVVDHLEVPLLLAGLRIDRADRAVALRLRAERRVGPSACAATPAAAWNARPAGVLLPGFPRRNVGLPGDDRVVVPRRQVEQSRARAVRRRVPVRAALRSRLDVGALDGRLGVGRPDGPPLRIESFVPVLLHEGLAHQELTGDAIQHVEEPVAIPPQHRLARLPLPGDVGEYRHLYGVPVELVVRRELVVPFELPCVGVEGNDRVGVEIVARVSRASGPAGIRVAGAPERQVRCRIVGAGHPDRRAAVLPRVARPRIVAGLAGLRDGIEFPDLLSGADVERGDPAIDAVFVRRRPEDDFVLDDERRDIELKALLPVDERPVPDRLAGLRVDRNQVPVVRGPEQAIPGDREALHDHQVRIRLGGHAVSEGPEAPPGGRVERHDLAVLDGVEHAVHDERRGLHLVEVLGTPHPLQRQTPDVLRLDLIEQTIPLARIAAAVGEPVLRLALRVQHPIQRRRRVRRRDPGPLLQAATPGN